jgi:hypothetical protein
MGTSKPVRHSQHSFIYYLIPLAQFFFEVVKYVQEWRQNPSETIYGDVDWRRCIALGGS